MVPDPVLFTAGSEGALIVNAALAPLAEIVFAVEPLFVLGAAGFAVGLAAGFGAGFGFCFCLSCAKS